MSARLKSGVSYGLPRPPIAQEKGAWAILLLIILSAGVGAIEINQPPVLIGQYPNSISPGEINQFDKMGEVFEAQPPICVGAMCDIAEPPPTNYVNSGGGGGGCNFACRYNAYIRAYNSGRKTCFEKMIPEIAPFAIEGNFKGAFPILTNNEYSLCMSDVWRMTRSMLTRDA